MTEMASVIIGGMEIVTQEESAEPVENKPAQKTGKGKTPKEPKAKKPSAPKKPRSPPTHPPYEEMIKDAIVTLKEKTGSSQYAITKFIEEKQKQLPSNFKKLLLFHLKKLVASGKIVRVKSSFKLPPVEKKKPVVAKVTLRPKSVASKAKAPAKAKPTAKPKAKAKPAAKPKAASAATKKAAAKPKLKEKPAKASRTSTRTSPGKKVGAPKPAPKKAMAVKKAPAKSVKPKSMRSPVKAKKVTTAKRGRK